MITSSDIALKVKSRLNKLDTQDDENLPKWVIVEAYNKGQLNVINRLCGKNNIYKTGVESTRKRIDDIKILLNPDPVRLRVVRKDGYYLTDSLPSDYFHFERVTCKAKNSRCSSKDVFIYIQEEANLNILLKNENVNPSFEWGETIGTLVGNKVKILTSNKFDVLNAYLTYIKKPRNIDIAGYTKIDQTPSTNINPELPDDIVEMCIEETVRILSGDLQNGFSNQISQQNLQMTE